MRAPPLRPIAALALAGALLGATLSGCGKGGASPRSGAGSGTLGAAPAAHGVVGVATKNTTRLGGADPAADAAAVAQAVYLGLTPATRPQAVVLVDERNWPAALAASALASAPLGAPLLYAEGDSLPDATVQALRAMRPIGAASLGGAQVIRIGTSAAVPDGLRTRTIPTAGAGEAAAMAAAVQELFGVAHGGNPRQAIVVAADAPRQLQMPAAALSAESGSPIVLIERTSVPAAARTALKALHNPAIYVVAPTTLDSRAYAELAPLGTVVHVAGGAGESPSARESADAVENAISVSRFSHGTFGWGIHEAGHGLVFANVSRPLDAPAAAALSAHGDYGPLLLLADSASVPGPLTQYLSDIEPGYTAAAPPVREVYNHGWLIGDERSISALAQAELDSVLEIAPRQPSAAEQSVAHAE
ncbi:MAG TPA: cell wall-binding repeat-containing protein [Solirubrobacteraceae bacterium]|jgi:hypothetical protein|nr:cell wall-binding repeat-containing protein [Solirubrobacteraceae bacterium]